MISIVNNKIDDYGELFFITFFAFVLGDFCGRCCGLFHDDVLMIVDEILKYS